MRAALKNAVLLVGSVAFASAAQAGPIQTLTLDDCDSMGCEGSTLTLSVEDNMDGTFTVLQSLDSTDFNEVRLGLNQVGFKAIKDWTAVQLIAEPSAGWLDPPIEANVSANGLCKNGGTTDKVCTNGFVDITNDDVYEWEYLVTGGTVMDKSGWHWGGQYANDATKTVGKIISATQPIPEPNAAAVFAVGVLVVGRSLSRRRR